MSDYGWALVLAFVVVVGAFRIFTRRTGKRLTPMQAMLPIPVSFVAAAIFVSAWRAVQG
ncbi:hypothetical protein [Pseudomonas vancouverensis]|nr:hypothetical protein [Pseudomonas vancouverensis]SDU99761.1 hypothetical protein SAMN05216558_1634 [Pseudomonas vancouverensis]